MICEYCEREHNGSYGSGRFCSSKCAKTYSTSIKRPEINKKVSKTIKEKLSKGEKIGFAQRNDKNIIINNCPICDKQYTTRKYSRGLYRKTCSKKCSDKLRIKSYKENKGKKVGGYRKGSGRGKSGWYKGYWCDSSYELAFVIYNIDHNIKFERNNNFFLYQWEGKTHKYYPDFNVSGTLYEIKGYETKKDEGKYSSVNEPLVILTKNKLKKILFYVKKNYGDDFIKLYEGNPHYKLTNICKVCGKLCKEKNIYCSRQCAGKGNNRNSVYKSTTGEIV